MSMGNILGLTVTGSISAITVFFQGLLSFFSPCVLPLIPLYIGYLSGGTQSGSDTEHGFSRVKMIINTIFFVAGVGFSFFLLGLGMRAVGRFFSGNQELFADIGGLIVVLFGLYQLGAFGSPSLLVSERRLPVRFEKLVMSPITAFLMGFVFSFAWTPCVGPALSGVLLMATSEGSSIAGFALIGVYTLGFAIPFLLAGFFTTSILNLFRKHMNIVRYTVRISGVLLIFMGVLMITGNMKSITGFLSGLSADNESAVEAVEDEDDEEEPKKVGSLKKKSSDSSGEPEESYSPESTDVDSDEIKSSDEDDEFDDEEYDEYDDEYYDEEYDDTDLLPAPDFTLKDQYGRTHKLSDYKGKVVFLNFWATWCPPCREEMPYIQEIYEETTESGDPEVVILGVAFPGAGDEQNEKGIKNFLEENGYTYPVLMDHDESLVLPYYITSYPTTYMIDKKGNVYGYVPGGMTRDMMEEIIEETIEGSS